MEQLKRREERKDRTFIDERRIYLINTVPRMLI